MLGGPGAVSPRRRSRPCGATRPGSVTRLAGRGPLRHRGRRSAQSTFPSGVGIVFIATGRNYPDALAAGAEAARQRAPILLVVAGPVPAATATRARAPEAGPDRGHGWTGAISDAVLASCAPTPRSVDRVAGADRYADGRGPQPRDASRPTRSQHGVPGDGDRLPRRPVSRAGRRARSRAAAAGRAESQCLPAWPTSCAGSTRPISSSLADPAPSATESRAAVRALWP